MRRLLIPLLTAGRVSAPRPFLRRLVQRLAPDRVPVLAIGR